MAELKIIRMDEVPVEENGSVISYIPFGKLSIIHGDGGEGKPLSILQLAALFVQGESFLRQHRQRADLKLFIRPQRTGSRYNQATDLAGNADVRN